MKDAHGMEVGSGLMEPGKGGVQMNAGKQNDVDDMQKKLDQLKHLWRR